MTRGAIPEGNIDVMISGYLPLIVVAELTGGDMTRQEIEYVDPESFKQEVELGNMQFSQIVARFPFKPEKHDPILVLWNSYCGQLCDIFCKPKRVCPERVDAGMGWSWVNCIWSGCNPPSSNKGSNNISTMELRFRAGDFKPGTTGVKQPQSLGAVGSTIVTSRG